MTMIARIVALVLLAAAIGAPTALAQSSSDYTRWLEWCRSINGVPNGDPNNPRCDTTGGGGSGGEYSGGTPAIIQWLIDRQARQNERVRIYNEIINQAGAAADRGDIDTFNRLARQAQPVSGETRRRLAVWIRNTNWNYWLNLGNLADRERRYADAAHYWERMLDYAENADERRQVRESVALAQATVLWERANTMQHDPVGRLALYEQAIALNRNVASADGLAMVAWVEAQAAEREGDLRRALRLYRAAIDEPFNDTDYNRSYVEGVEFRLGLAQGRTPAEQRAQMEGFTPQDDDATAVRRSINAAVRDWDRAERGRIRTAFAALENFTDRSEGMPEIDAIWNDMRRAQRPADVSFLSAGLSPAGLQRGQECAVYAMATASGRSYEEVATLAAAIIARAAYRSRGERENPRGTLHSAGLNGGELLVLAEALGQAEVIQPERFAATVRDGRPVMVAVWIPSGQRVERHQIVLSGAFEYQGATWFEVIDSNQTHRNYVSLENLSRILAEPGVAYRPDSRPPHTF
jgi:tetratricopeptide (TPR) repeat protein